MIIGLEPRAKPRASKCNETAHVINDDSDNGEDRRQRQQKPQRRESDGTRRRQHDGGDDDEDDDDDGGCDDNDSDQDNDKRKSSSGSRCVESTVGNKTKQERMTTIATKDESVTSLSSGSRHHQRVLYRS